MGKCLLRAEATALAPAIGAGIRGARKAQGFTLEQVAHTAGLSKGFLSRLEPHNWEADPVLGAEVVWTIVPASWRGE